MSEILDLKAVEAQLLDTHTALEGFIEKSNKELEEAQSVSAETKGAIDKLAEQSVEHGDRLAEMEQAQSSHYAETQQQKSIGEMLTESDEFKAFHSRQSTSMSLELKTAIVNAVPSMSQPLVAGHRLDGIVKEPDRALHIRDALPVGRTTSNIVFFPKENTFTNAAAVVVGGSPTISAENVSKPEAALTFTSDSEEVKTIAHWIPISRQVLDDSSVLQSYVNDRLMYGLKLTEDGELLNGAGTLGTITGLWASRTAAAQADSPVSYTTALDLIRDAKRQAHASNYMPDLVILNPKDWSDIELQKETTGGYIFSHPQGVIQPTLWGMRVLISNTMTAGRYIVMSSRVAQIWDRWDATIELSREEGNNFTKNMVTILAEERLAFTVYNTAGIIGGTF